jgi:hypothetical protein
MHGISSAVTLGQETILNEHHAGLARNGNNVNPLRPHGVGPQIVNQQLRHGR